MRESTTQDIPRFPSPICCVMHCAHDLEEHCNEGVSEVLTERVLFRERERLPVASRRQHDHFSAEGGR
jgi:hypothetical protein